MILQRIWQRFLYESNRNYNPYKFSYKFAFTLFYHFVETKNKNQRFTKFVVW